MRIKSLLITAAVIGLVKTGQAQLTQTNLPIVIITHSGTMADTQILGTMKIVDNSSGSNQPGDAAKFQGNIGVKFRGSSTYAKRSYNVETWTNLQGVSLDTSLLGLPRDNDWVLIAAYTDRSLMRNLLTFKLWEQMGYYAPRMKYVELIINNDYRGVYLFGEKVKRGTDRIDIANLKTTDATPPQITGGYIFRIDNSNDGYWTSTIAPPYASSGQTIKFHFDEPDDNDITPVQKNYIKSYTDSFETALNASNFQDTTLGWRGYAGHNSFEDYLLLNEVLKNRDAYRQGVYLWKDKSKKLRVGPPWDMELALYNTTDCNAAKDTGFAYNHSVVCGTDTYLAPFWWQKLSSDTAYMRDVKCKYTYWRKTGSVLDTTKIFAAMDSVSTLLNAQQAVSRNFTKYPIFGTALVNEPTPLSTSFSDEVGKLKAFVRKRLQYLDSKWLTPGCVLSLRDISNQVASIDIYPNPATTQFTARIQLKQHSSLQIIMRDLLGRVVMQKGYNSLVAGTHQFSYPLDGSAPGVYSITVVADGHAVGTYKLVKH